MNALSKALRNFGDYITRYYLEPQSFDSSTVTSSGIGKARALEILLMDSSNSMTATDYNPSRIQAAKDACFVFVSSLRKRNEDIALGIVSFGMLARTVLPPIMIYSIGPNRISNRVQALCANGLATNTHKGLLEASRLIDESGLTPKKCRVILLTDGHTTSGLDPREEAFRIKDSGVQIDVIGIGGAPKDVRESELRDIASVVDGETRYWFIDSVPELFRKFEVLAVRRAN